MPSQSPFDRIIWFGDSLTDAGTIHDLTERTTIVTLPSQSSGYTEAFTNGAVHAEITSGLLSLRDDNYAVGYGHAVGSLTLEAYAESRLDGQIAGLDIFQPDAAQSDLDFDLYLGGQIERFLEDADAEGEVPGSAAAFIIGLNDYSEFRPTSAATAQAEGAALVAGVVGATITAAAAVAATGVETILLYTMPSFRFFPLSGTQSEEILALGDQLVDAHNTGLAQGAALLELNGVDVEFIDFNRLAADIMRDPGTFGLRADLFAQPLLLGTGANPTLVELPDGSFDTTFPANPAAAGVDLDQLAFMDLIHPTAAVHGILGVFSAETLTSETFFSGSGDDAVSGTGSSDLILSGAGNDRIFARSGADVVLAGLGRDIATGGNGQDILAAGSGSDTLAGGRGRDVLADGAGQDRSLGGRGEDLLIDGASFDVLSGGREKDAFVLMDATLRGGSPAGQGGCMIGGRGFDTAWLILSEDTRALVEADLVAGAARQSFDAVGLTTKGIEAFVFLDATDDLDAIGTTARLAEADLWGLI